MATIRNLNCSVIKLDVTPELHTLLYAIVCCVVVVTAALY